MGFIVDAGTLFIVDDYIELEQGRSKGVKVTGLTGVQHLVGSHSDRY